jgi:arabinofuranosyltransferase
MGIALAAFHWQSRLAYPIDDTFITFRYASNLANGHGLVWNVDGPPTEGYTNFLYVVILSLFRGSDMLLAAQAINCLAVIASAVLIWMISARFVQSVLLALASSLAYLLTPMTWANALSGMETVVFGMLLLLGSFLLLRDERPNVSGYLILFLASLCRPEGSLLIAIWVVYHFAQTGARSLMPALLGALIPTLLYYTGKHLYFGQMLPNSFYIKVPQEGVYLHGLQAVKLFLLRAWPIVLAGIALIVLRVDRKLWSVLVWSVLIIAAYAVPSPLMGFFDRFFYSSEIFLYPLTGIAVWLLGQRVGKGVAIAAGSVLALALVVTNIASPRAREVSAWDLDAINSRLGRIALDLRSLPHSSDLMFASSDAGIIPYFSGMKHYDLAGLNTTEIARAGNTTEVVDKLLKERPEILILSADWSPLGADDTVRTISRHVHGKLGPAISPLLADPRFQDYIPTAVFLTGVYDYAVLLDSRSSSYATLRDAFESMLGSNPVHIRHLVAVR